MRAPVLIASLFAGLALIAWIPSAAAESAKMRTSAEAAALVAAGKAVLVDVREPDEVADSMVAAPAFTLAMSDLRDGRVAWKPFLEAHGDKEIILYCRSGGRAGQAAAILAAEGFAASNAGGLKDWRAAGLPVRDADEPRR